MRQVMPNASSIFIYLALILVAGGSYWLGEQLFPKESAKPKQARGEIDYYTNHINRMVMDVHGKPKELLVADALVHFQLDDRTEMDKPVMTLFQGDDPPWIIRAETGKTLAEGAEVFLNGDVLITRESKQGDTFKIVTRNVKYLPDQHYAETAEPVLMFGPKDRLSGTGMQVHFEPQLVARLLSNVKRTHETQ